MTASLRDLRRDSLATAFLRLALKVEGSQQQKPIRGIGSASVLIQIEATAGGVARRRALLQRLLRSEG